MRRFLVIFALIGIAVGLISVSKPNDRGNIVPVNCEIYEDALLVTWEQDRKPKKAVISHAGVFVDGATFPTEEHPFNWGDTYMVRGYPLASRPRQETVYWVRFWGGRSPDVYVDRECWEDMWEFIPSGVTIS